MIRERFSPLNKILALFAFKAPLLIFLLVGSYYRATQRNEVAMQMSSSRHLLGDFLDESCKTYFDSHGGVALYLLGIGFCLIAIAVICEEDFKNSIILLAKGLHMPPDVAGATLMAAGTSSPELFASLVALGAPSDDVGSGTIVGSVVFNTLIIIGGSALFSGGKTFLLDKGIMFRDCFWNFVSIAYLLCSFWDSSITWYEALVACLLYVLYALHMSFQAKIHAFLGRLLSRLLSKCPSCCRPNQVETIGSDAGEDRENVGGSSDFEEDGVHDDSYNPGLSDSEHTPVGEHYEPIHPIPHPFSIRPKGVKEWVEAFFFFPWKMIFYYTIPNPQSPLWKHMYVVSFSVCLLWLATLTWMMIGWATKVGCVLGIDDAIMGATVLAVGTSMPDCLTSIAVAKDGQGSMAVSNALGSNIFDILVALGFPWLLEAAISGGANIPVESSTIAIDSGMCFVALFIVIISLAINRWKLNNILGFIYAGTYLLFLGYLIGYPIYLKSKN